MNGPSRLDGASAGFAVVESGGHGSSASGISVAEYYERKTESIVRRYGPGPRVHFHVGLLERAECAARSALQLRAMLRRSQHRMLTDSAEFWNLRRIDFRRVLDVGCGLGGPAIFWAQEFGADVTAITIAPSHVGLAAEFAAQAGVATRVHPMLCDALEVPGAERFEAIVALDSSCHLRRREWFRRAAQLLTAGGGLFLADCLVEREGMKAALDRYWHADFGGFTEYLNAARGAGLIVRAIRDVSNPAANFWGATMALIESESAGRVDCGESAKSLEVHAMMRRGLIDGSLRHLLISFGKPR